MLNFSSLLFLVLPLFGWTVLRTLLGINSLIYLLPFSFVFGLATFMVLIYALAFFLGIQKASLLVLLILFLVSICLIVIYKRQACLVENPLKRKELLILFFICLFIGCFTCLLTDKWIIWDFLFHTSVANYFAASDKFPNGVPNWPSLFIAYHYAFNLLSAVIIQLTGINDVNSFRLIAIFSSLITFLSSFAIAYFFATSHKYIQALFGSLCFYFAGNLLWLDALVRYVFKIFPVQENWSLFKTMCALGMHGSFMSDLGSGGVLFASIALGVPFFLLLLFLFLKFLFADSISIKYLLSIFISSLILFHTAEWILYIFILALVFSPFLSRLLKNELSFKQLLIRNFICVLIFLAIILFNGLAFKMLSKDYSYLPGYFELTINPNLFSFEVFGRFGDLNQHRIISAFSWDFICELGLPFIFSIFVIYWTIREKMKWTSFILSFLLISFIAPFFLYIKTSPPDVLRMFHPAFEILSLLFGLWIIDLRYRFKPLRHLALVPIILVILPPIFTLIMSGIFSPSIYLAHNFIDFVEFSFKELASDKDITKFSAKINSGIKAIQSSVQIDDSDIKVASYLRAYSRNDEYGLSNRSLPFDSLGLPCYSIRGSSLPRKVTYITLLQSLDPYLLKELKIKWIYLEPLTARFVNLLRLKELIKSGFLKIALSVDLPYAERVKASLLELVDVDKYFSLYPRKTYWTFLTYLNEKIIYIPDSSGNQVMYLFKSEKEATNFLKEQIKINPEFKSYKPFVDALSEEIIKQQSSAYNLVLKYVE